MKQTHMINVPGLRELNDRSSSALATARALVEPLQHLAGQSLVALLPSADVACGETQIHDRLSSNGWPKSWRATTLVRGIVPHRGALNAEIVVHYDLYDTASSDYWKASIVFPDLPLLLEPDAELLIEMHAAPETPFCSITACSLPESRIPALVAILGDIFGGECRVETTETCDWRPPPAQPSTRSEIAVADFGERFHRENPLNQLEDLKRPVQRLATAMLGVAVPGVRSELHPFEMCQKSVGDDATVCLDSVVTAPRGGPQVTIHLEYCSIMQPNLSFALTLDRYLPQWSKRGVFSLHYDSRDADLDGGAEHLTLLLAQSFPSHWREQLLAAVSHALDRPCHVIDEQPMMLRSRLTENERAAIDTSRYSDD